MNAVEIIRQQARMCDEMESCKVCPIGQEATGQLCRYYRLDHPEKAAELIEKWAKEHPEKTRKQDFLEKYPNALLRESDDTPRCCPSALGYTKDSCCPTDERGFAVSCTTCWNLPVEGSNV